MATVSPLIIAITGLGSFNHFHQKRMDGSDLVTILTGEIGYICCNWVELNDYFYGLRITPEGTTSIRFR